VQLDSGDLVLPPSPYDNSWATRAQAEQEAGRRDPPRNGSYVVKERAVAEEPDVLRTKSGRHDSFHGKPKPNAFAKKRVAKPLGEKRQFKVSRRAKGPSSKKY